MAVFDIGRCWWANQHLNTQLTGKITWAMTTRTAHLASIGHEKRWFRLRSSLQRLSILTTMLSIWRILRFVAHGIHVHGYSANHGDSIHLSQSLHKRILYRGIDLNTISVSTSRRSTILHHKEIGTSEHNFQGGQSNDSADYGSSQIIENTPAPRISLTPKTSLPWRSRCKLSSTAISEPLNWANWSHFVSNLKTRKTNTNDVQFHQLTTSSLISSSPISSNPTSSSSSEIPELPLLRN